MPLQDLTPQLRTRLSRLERVVGLFVTFATLLLFFGAGYYAYTVAKRKGWFLKKVPYHTYVNNASGLKVGQPVKLMGFDVGSITKVEAMPPYNYFNVYLQFQIKEPYYGYLWSDSKAKIAAADFLGNRYLEVTKGAEGVATVLETNEVRKNLFTLFQPVTNKVIVGLLDKWGGPTNPVYHPFTNGAKGFWLRSDESPALTERLENVVSSVEKALPGFLELTNSIKGVLTRLDKITTHADELLVSAQPSVTNLQLITSHLTQPEGSLGEWLIPTNLNRGLANTLDAAQITMTSAQTNLTTLTSNLTVSLVNVADLTSNLNAQVEANSFILSQISDLVAHANDMVQGLKRHWLFKGAFNPSTNEPIHSVVRPSFGEP